MIVSGGKILAIGKVNTDGTTVSGDGVKIPLGVFNGGLKTYSVEAGNDNITVNSAYDGNNVIFKINGNSTKSTYSAYPGGQIIVDNDEMSLALEPAFINSASIGYNAMKTINENSAAWSNDTTYTAGSNIDITKQVISGRDWTPELNTKVNADTFNPWSLGVENSAATMSAYIKANETYWVNSGFNVQSTTPDYLSVASSYDPTTRTVTYDVSAKEQKNYSAGNWVDSDKLSSGIVEVSGQKTFKTKSPLYFSADASDPNIVWLLQDDKTTPTTTEAILIANGWYGSEYYDNGAGLSASIPVSNINAEYIFHFERQMGIQININAKFVAHASASDKIGKVGFGAATIGGQQFTNPITYSMLGALGEQYYAASTIARVAADNFPEEGIDLSFKFVGDSDFLKEIQNPCITVHEVVE